MSEQLATQPNMALPASPDALLSRAKEAVAALIALIIIVAMILHT